MGEGRKRPHSKGSVYRERQRNGPPSLCSWHTSYVIHTIGMLSNPSAMGTGTWGHSETIEHCWVEGACCSLISIGTLQPFCSGKCFLVCQHLLPPSFLCKYAFFLNHKQLEKELDLDSYRGLVNICDNVGYTMLHIGEWCSPPFPPPPPSSLLMILFLYDCSAALHGHLECVKVLEKVCT